MKHFSPEYVLKKARDGTINYPNFEFAPFKGPWPTKCLFRYTGAAIRKSGSLFELVKTQPPKEYFGFLTPEVSNWLRNWAYFNNYYFVEFDRVGIIHAEYPYIPNKATGLIKFAHKVSRTARIYHPFCSTIKLCDCPPKIYTVRTFYPETRNVRPFKFWTLINHTVSGDTTMDGLLEHEHYTVEPYLVPPMVQL